MRPNPVGPMSLCLLATRQIWDDGQFDAFDRFGAVAPRG